MVSHWSIVLTGYQFVRANREWKVKSLCAAKRWLTHEITSLLQNDKRCLCLIAIIDCRFEKPLGTRDLVVTGTRSARWMCRRGCNPRHDIPDHVRTHPKGILVGIFVACRVKNCQHLNRLRHDDEKRGYRPDADDSQLDTACRLSDVHGFRCMTTHSGPIARNHAGGWSCSLSVSFNERPNRSPRTSSTKPPDAYTSKLACVVN